jgi:hypothetical protein
MFHVHGIQGHVFSGTLEQLRERRAVAAGAVAPVADAGGRVVGFVSRTDLLRALAAGAAAGLRPGGARQHGRSAAKDLLPGSVSRHALAEGRADVLVSTAHGA